MRPVPLAAVGGQPRSDAPVPGTGDRRCAVGHSERHSTQSDHSSGPPRTRRCSYIEGVRLGSELGSTRPIQRGDASLLDVAAIGMAVTAMDGRILLANPMLARMLGYAPGELADRSLADITHPDDCWPMGKALSEISDGTESTFRQRQRCLSADGGLVWVDLVLGLAPSREGLPRQCLAQFIDVNAEMAHLQTLEASVRHFQVLSENSTDIVAQVDPQGVIIWISPSVAGVLGWETGLLAGKNIAFLIPQGDLELFSEAMARIRQGADAPSRVIRFRSTSGACRFMSVALRPLAVDGGLITGVALGIRDVTEELRAKRELARSEEQFRMAMHGAPEGMAVSDAHDRIVQANPALCDVLGTSIDNLIGHRFREFMPPEDRGQAEELRERLLLGELETSRQEHRLISSSGEVWVDHSVGVLRDETGRPQLFVHQLADRTAARRRQADLTYRATHDIHTGLANRDNLHTRLSQRLGFAPAATDKVGVMYCDIDNLKPINDRLGHMVGDQVIATTAERLKQAVRRKDLVARVGGDEFVIVLDQCGTVEELLLVARNVQTAASQPLQTEAGAVEITLSIGAVLADSSWETDDALARADHALYRAKRAGGNQVAVGEMDLGRH